MVYGKQDKIMSFIRSVIN